MMRAVRAYQERYRPKLETLGLNLIESRILIVLNDFSGLGPDEMVTHLLTPVSEIRAALLSLSDRGFVMSNGEGYVLTELGLTEANQIWNLAEAHATESFKQFSSEEVDTFTKVLRQLICQQ